MVNTHLLIQDIYMNYAYWGQLDEDKHGPNDDPTLQFSFLIDQGPQIKRIAEAAEGAWGEFFTNAAYSPEYPALKDGNTEYAEDRIRKANCKNRYILSVKARETIPKFINLGGVPMRNNEVMKHVKLGCKCDIFVEFYGCQYMKKRFISKRLASLKLKEGFLKDLRDYEAMSGQVPDAERNAWFDVDG